MADYEYSGDNGDQQFAEDPSNTNFEQQEAITASAVTAEGSGGGERINASKNEDDERNNSLSSRSNFDHDNRKIFVGGLSWETTAKDLKEYFSKFGEVADCTLKVDVETGRSRGFGFVLFNASESVDKVVEHENHVLQGRNIDPKRANPRGSKEPIKKVFVGGLDPDTPEDEIRTHFSQFGKIEEIDLPYDKIKGQRRAFCFITFESEAVVDKCCEKPKQSIGTKEVDVKKATPKDQRGEFGGRGRGGWGNGPPRGRGRGRGGYNQGWGNDAYGYDYYNQGYGAGYGGYDYNQGYGAGYDYNNYYNQGWGGYNQGYGSGYGSGYGNSGYGGYDYGGWYGTEQGGDTSGQAGSYGKVKRGGTAPSSSTATSTYHPYSR